MKISEYADSMKQAAAMTGKPLAALKAAKAAGCPAFRGSRVAIAELETWLKANPEVAKAKDTTWKTRIDREKHRKLKMENDIKADTLISRAWMAERVHVAFGKMQEIRVKAEAEHPLQFAGLADNVPACREVVMKQWDEILAAFNALKVEFVEKKGTHE